MISSNYSNFTTFGIKNEAERYTWAAWLVFILICSLLGDTVILVACIKYNVFTLHGLIVAFIQHIAVCDLLCSLVNTFPRIVSVIANRWVFGTILSYIVVHSTYVAAITNVLLICFMTSSKLWLLKYPLRARTWSKVQAHKLCACTWVLSFAVPCASLIDGKGSVVWDYRTYYNDYAYVHLNNWSLLEFTVTAITVIPSIVVIITSVLLIKHLLKAREVSNRSRGEVRWQGIATVVAVAIVCNVSSLPVNIAYIIEPLVTEDSNPFHTYAIRSSTTFVYFNVASNFFVYYCTVKSFKSFINARIQQIASHAFSISGPNTGRQTDEEHQLRSLHLEEALS